MFGVILMYLVSALVMMPLEPVNVSSRLAQHRLLQCTGPSSLPPQPGSVDSLPQII